MLSFIPDSDKDGPPRLGVLAAKKDFMAVVKQNNKRRKPGTPSSHEHLGEDLPARGTTDLPTDLHLSARSSLADMAPSDIIFLDDFTYLRESFSPNFIALLACPLCGSPGLITSAQFSGGAPIVCTSKICSGQFRIVNEAQILPVRPS